MLKFFKRHDSRELKSLSEGPIDFHGPSFEAPLALSTHEKIDPVETVIGRFAAKTSFEQLQAPGAHLDTKE